MYKGQEYLIEGFELYPDKIKGMLILREILKRAYRWEPADDKVLDQLISEYLVEDK